MRNSGTLSFKRFSLQLLICVDVWKRVGYSNLVVVAVAAVVVKRRVAKVQDSRLIGESNIGVLVILFVVGTIRDRLLLVYDYPCCHTAVSTNLAHLSLDSLGHCCCYEQLQVFADCWS